MRFRIYQTNLHDESTHLNNLVLMLLMLFMDTPVLPLLRLREATEGIRKSLFIGSLPAE
jgi:hypothetical protein